MAVCTLVSAALMPAIREPGAPAKALGTVNLPASEPPGGSAPETPAQRGEPRGESTTR